MCHNSLHNNLYNNLKIWLIVKRIQLSTTLVVHKSNSTLDKISNETTYKKIRIHNHMRKDAQSKSRIRQRRNILLNKSIAHSKESRSNTISTQTPQVQSFLRTHSSRMLQVVLLGMQSRKTHPKICFWTKRHPANQMNLIRKRYLQGLPLRWRILLLISQVIKSSRSQIKIWDGSKHRILQKSPKKVLIIWINCSIP